MIGNTHTHVVQGIHTSIQSQTQAKAPRNRDAETFIKKVVAACLFTIVKQKGDVGNNEVNRLLGTSVNQINLAQKTIRGLITTPLGTVSHGTPRGTMVGVQQ